MSEPSLRTKARQLIRVGSLPQRPPDRVWGGAGYGGSVCRLCDARIGIEEVAMEVEYVPTAGTDALNAYFHTQCFLALEHELLILEATGRAPADRPADALRTPVASQPPVGFGSQDAALP